MAAPLLRGPGVVSRQSLPPEVDFLLDVVIARLRGTPLRPAGEPDWNRVLACIRHHRLEPLTAPALTAAGGMPEETRDRLRAMRRRAAAGAMAHASELARLAAAFAAAGVEMLALKGPAFAILLYSDLSARFCRDIDLLVRPEMEGAARAVLADCGYGTTPASVIRDVNAVKLLHEQGRGPVELHVRLSSDERLLPEAALAPFDTAITVMVAGVSVRTLSIETALAYAAYHGAGHHWSRLYWLADIAAAAIRPDVDWRQVADIARRAGVERHLGLATALSAALLGVTAKNAPIPAGQDAAAIRRAEAVVFDLLRAPPTADLPALQKIGQFRILRADLGLYTRLSARWALLSVRAQPAAADRSVVTVPEKLLFLYYVIRIFRVIRQGLVRFFSA